MIKHIMDCILNSIIEKRFFQTIICTIDLFVFKIFILISSRLTKINKKKIVFTNFSGNYECNPKYICEEILKRGLPYELIWVIWGKGLHKNKVDPGCYPEKIALSKRYSYEFYKHLFSAKIIIDNGTSFGSAKYIKKKKQILINTWHGSLGIKKFPKNDNDQNIAYNKKANTFGKITDYVISNSDFENMYYRETYFSNSEIKKLGHARNDLFFNQNKEFTHKIKEKVYKFFSLPKDTKICLYAPTFRDDMDISPYKLPYEKIVDALANRFGSNEKWIILTRFHHSTKKMLSKINLPECTISATEYPDIHELMLCADVGITDYSSWICEYIHTKKPGFLFATDIDKYDVERGFYDPLDSMPFPLATNSDELIEKIISFDQEKYLVDVKEFLKRKGCIDDGHASERIVDFIEELMERM